MWHKVEDELPERKEIVVILDKNGNWGRGWRNFAGWYSSDINSDEKERYIDLPLDSYNKFENPNPLFLDLDNIVAWMRIEVPEYI